MKRARATLLATALVVSIAVIDAAPASAHGQCATSFTPPTWDGNVSTHTWSWTGRVDCTESHPDYLQWSCLESSPSALLGAWTTEWCSDTHTWAGPGTSFVWPYSPGSYTACKAQYAYRVYGVGAAGNGGDHWGMRGTSAAVIPCPILLNASR